jgi:hypothetical protein
VPGAQQKKPPFQHPQQLFYIIIFSLYRILATFLVDNTFVTLALSGGQEEAEAKVQVLFAITVSVRVQSAITDKITIKTTKN